jgi:acyl-CoA thioesterase FadM
MGVPSQKMLLVRHFSVRFLAFARPKGVLELRARPRRKEGDDFSVDIELVHGSRTLATCSSTWALVPLDLAREEKQIRLVP